MTEIVNIKAVHKFFRSCLTPGNYTPINQLQINQDSLSNTVVYGDFYAFSENNGLQT